MKNLNSLLARLGALSLAAAMTFSAAEAATARKDPKAAAAVIEALVHQAAVKATTTPVVSGANQIFSTPVVVGAGSTGAANPDGQARNLTVLGDVRAAGDLEAGALGALQTKDGKPVFDNQGNFIYKTPGRKHIVGIASLNPRTQQFRVVFKDKTAASHGAFVSLDFVTTATGRFGSTVLKSGEEDENDKVKASGKKATVGVRFPNIFCHPQLNSSQIYNGLVGSETEDWRQKFVLNGYTQGSLAGDTDGAKAEAKLAAEAAVKNTAADLRLALFVRVEEGTTNNVNFGFVPSAKGDDGYYYPATTSDDSLSGFYEANWARRAEYPVYEDGTLSYQVASDNVVSVGVVNSVANGELLPADVFELFTDDELVSLLAILKDYFGEDVVKMREYLVAHRHQLSRAFKAIR